MENSEKLPALLIDISFYSLNIFYAIIFLRWLAPRVSFLSKTKFGIASKTPWVDFSFYGTAALMIAGSLLYKEGGSLTKDLFGPWQAWSILSIVTAIAILFPHIVVAIEYRIKPSKSVMETLLHIFMISLAYASTPQALIIVNQIMIVGDFAETGLINDRGFEAVLRKYFVLPQAITENGRMTTKIADDLGLFWFEKTFQATLWDVPSTFGFNLSDAQPEPTNRFMSVLIIINQITLKILSIFMVFAGPIQNKVVNLFSKGRS